MFTRFHDFYQLAKFNILSEICKRLHSAPVIERELAKIGMPVHFKEINTDKGQHSFEEGELQPPSDAPDKRQV